MIAEHPGGFQYTPPPVSGVDAGHVPRDACDDDEFPYNAGVAIRVAIDARKLTDYGIGTYLSHLLRGVAERPEIELVVVAHPRHEERVRALVPEVRLVPVAAPGYSVREHIQLPLALWRERPDLVHFPHYVMPLVLPRPAVVTVHDVIQLFYPPAPRARTSLWYLRVMMRFALRRARFVVTPSRASRSDLIGLFGADGERLRVVPMGVDPNLGQRPPAAEIEALKTRYGLKPPLVLVVGNDKPHKNFDLVLRTFHLARRRHRLPGQLVFVGGVRPDGRIASRCARLGLEDRVRFLGRIPGAHLHAVYHVAAVLLHVALYEGFGLPILEAMRVGLPVVTSNLGAMRELGEGAARLVNPLDVDEVAGAVERVLVDDPLRRRMIDAGRRKAENLTWERMTAETVAVYRDAVGGNGT